MEINEVLSNHNVIKQSQSTTVDYFEGGYHQNNFIDYSHNKKQYLAIETYDSKDYLNLIDYSGEKRIRYNRVMNWAINDSIMLDDRIILGQQSVTSCLLGLDYNGNIIFEYSNDISAIFSNSDSIGLHDKKNLLYFILDSPSKSKSYIYEFSLNGVLNKKIEVPKNYRIQSYIFDGENFYCSQSSTLLNIGTDGQIIKEKRFSQNVQVIHFSNNSIYVNVGGKYTVIDKNSFDTITETKELGGHYQTRKYNNKLIINYGNDIYILHPTRISYSGIDKKDKVLGYVKLLLSINNSTNTLKTHKNTALMNDNNNKLRYIEGGLK
ncbi:hypothetical protein [Clostridium sporogenes]|uniref:hypothetical protein n=1 Tax=Clostridium sporogenes TaxID=1509 RepID=UPI00066630B7|nr:hypothetical protein [Clostridium sporogenes]